MNLKRIIIIFFDGIRLASCRRAENQSQVVLHADGADDCANATHNGSSNKLTGSSKKSGNV